MNVTLDRAGGWLSGLAAERADELTARELALLLFGLATTERIGDAEAMAVRLLDGPIDEEIAAGRFAMPLLTARALPGGSRSRQALLAACAEREPPPSLRWDVPLSDTLLPYAAPADAVREICGEIAVASDFGLREPVLRYRDDLRCVLALWTFCFIHERDLEMVCPLGRALAFAGFSSAGEHSDAIQFILEQQRDDGHFCADELSAAAQAKTQPDFDVVREVYLPLTVGAVWTLSAL